MTTATFLPHSLLRSCIQAYVYLGPDCEGEGAIFDLFPTGYTTLVFLLNEQASFQDVQSRIIYTSRFHFVGQLTRYHQMQITYPEEICIVFKPAGAFRLFGLDQSCLADDSFAISDLFPAEGNAISQRLADAGQDIKQIIRILDRWLLKWWENNDHLHTGRIEDACRQIACCSGRIPIRSLCRKMGMSKSSLEAHFKIKTGISPKTYSRIMRFNHAYRQIKAYSTVDWQELIFRHNYFDQSHFIHEFKSFYGYSPSHVYASFHNLSAAIKEQAEQELHTSS